MVQNPLGAAYTVGVGELIYKKRPGATYTYVAVRHKMEQGYWEASLGKVGSRPNRLVLAGRASDKH